MRGKNLDRRFLINWICNKINNFWMYVYLYWYLHSRITQNFLITGGTKNYPTKYNSTIGWRRGGALFPTNCLNKPRKLTKKLLTIDVYSTHIQSALFICPTKKYFVLKNIFLFMQFKINCYIKIGFLKCVSLKR